MIQSLIERLEREGLRFYLDSRGALRWRHHRRLTTEERAAIREHCDQLVARIQRESEEMEIFASALAAIELGKPLGRLYPQLRGYLRKELTPEHFEILELAHKENNGNQREIS